jgi:hypothetical protein
MGEEDNNLSTEDVKIEGETEAIEETKIDSPEVEVKTDGDELEPPVIDSKEQARLHYEKRQLEKLKNVEEEPEITDEEKIIERVIEKKYGSTFADLEAQKRSQTVEAELRSILGSNPELTKHENKIRAWANHPSRANIPVRSVAAEVIGLDNLIKIGAKLGAAAASEAAQTKPTGTTAKPIKKSVADMTAEEFQADRQRILQGL